MTLRLFRTVESPVHFINCHALQTDQADETLFYRPTPILEPDIDALMNEDVPVTIGKKEETQMEARKDKDEDEEDDEESKEGEEGSYLEVDPEVEEIIEELSEL